MKRRNFLIKLVGASSGALLLLSCSKSFFMEPIISAPTILDEIKDKYGEVNTKTIEPNRKDGRRFPSSQYLVRAGKIEGNNLIYLFRNNSTGELFLPLNELHEQMISGYSVEITIANQQTKELSLIKF